MGLDSYIFSEEIPTEREDVLNKLDGTEAQRKKELYWRKHWEVVGFFNDYNGEEIENCDEFEITLECLTDFKKFLETHKEEEVDDGYNYYGENHITRLQDIKKIDNLIANTDFDKTKLYFYSWW